MKSFLLTICPCFIQPKALMISTATQNCGLDIRVSLGKPQKNRSFFVARPPKGGGGLRAWPIRKNTVF